MCMYIYIYVYVYVYVFVCVNVYVYVYGISPLFMGTYYLGLWITKTIRGLIMFDPPSSDGDFLYGDNHADEKHPVTL